MAVPTSTLLLLALAIVRASACGAKSVATTHGFALGVSEEEDGKTNVFKDLARAILEFHY